MKVMKYILFAVIVVTLWITESIWMPQSTYRSVTEEVENQTLIEEEEQNHIEFEAKFGKKSAVLPSLKKHWDNAYIDAVEFEFLKCSDISTTDKGWTTICRYRIQGFMRQNTYIINNGKVSK